MSQITRLLIDKQEIWEGDPRVATSMLLTAPGDLQWWSWDALREFLIGTCQLVTEWCQARIAENPADELLAKYKRYSTWAAKSVKNFPTKGQEQALIYVYNLAMAGQGMGLLHGFGMTNSFKDRLAGNPELRTLRVSERGD